MPVPSRLPQPLTTETPPPARRLSSTRKRRGFTGANKTRPAPGRHFPLDNAACELGLTCRSSAFPPSSRPAARLPNTCNGRHRTQPGRGQPSSQEQHEPSAGRLRGPRAADPAPENMRADGTQPRRGARRKRGTGSLFCTVQSLQGGEEESGEGSLRFVIPRPTLRERTENGSAHRQNGVPGAPMALGTGRAQPCPPARCPACSERTWGPT